MLVGSLCSVIALVVACGFCGAYLARLFARIVAVIRGSSCRLSVVARSR